ncbi:MAG: hypothetical protein ACKOX3_12590 [Bacteroidota bacterium]
MIATISGKCQRVFIYGKVIDEEYPSLPLQQVMVVNQQSQMGIFGGNDNSFQIQMDKNDTIIISALGYARKIIGLKDSIVNGEAHIIIGLHRLSYDLSEITVRRQRELRQISEDIKKLGYNKRDFKLTNVDAWQSPITALYQSFSKKEQNKRALAQMINDDNRRAVLKDLLYLYNLTELIRMPESEYNDFIDYLNVNDEQMQSMNDYDLAIFIRDRYLVYMNHKR